MRCIQLFLDPEETVHGVINRQSSIRWQHKRDAKEIMMVISWVKKKSKFKKQIIVMISLSQKLLKKQYRENWNTNLKGHAEVTTSFWGMFMNFI